MRTEVKIGIGFCFVLVLVVVAYVAYHGSGKSTPTSDRPGQVSRNAPSSGAPRAGQLPPVRPGAPTAQAPAPMAPRPSTAAPGGPISPLQPMAVASAPASQPTTREAVAVGSPLRPMEPVGAGPSGSTTPASPLATVMLPRGLTPMEPVSGTAAISQVTRTTPTGGSPLASINLSPLTSPGSTAAGGAYTVVSGDTLWKIAARTYGNGTQADLIRRANPGINGDRLQVGQKLILPPPSTSAAVSAPGSFSPLPAIVARPDTTSGAVRTMSTGSQYTIKPGDNPSAIAAREYGDERLAAAILKANPGLVATSLKVGQTIALPSRAQAQVLANVSSSAGSVSPAVLRTGPGTTANRSTPVVAASPAVARTVAPAARVQGKPDFSGRSH